MESEYKVKQYRGKNKNFMLIQKQTNKLFLPEA